MWYFIVSIPDLCTLITVSETKFNAIHPDSAFEVYGYQKPCRKDKETNSMDGILSCFQDGTTCSRRPDLENKNIECNWLEIKPVKSKPFLLGNILQNIKFHFSMELISFK